MWEFCSHAKGRVRAKERKSDYEREQRFERRSTGIVQRDIGDREAEEMLCVCCYVLKVFLRHFRTKKVSMQLSFPGWTEREDWIIAELFVLSCLFCFR